MLEIRKGKSVKSYENEFFRKISHDLLHVFKQREWDGLLLGMPECITREDLQIDALLITKNQLIIIDFKDYSGTLILPKEEAFKFGRWTMEDGVIVKGGSSANPFSQVAKQRVKLIDELNYRLPNFERKAISTLVCFQNKVDIIGQIPSNFKIGFGIVDLHTYIDKIIDILDVLDSERNFLSEPGKIIFEKTVFTADDYQITSNDIQENIKPAEVTEKTDIDLANEFKEFLLSDKKILTLTGNTRSGKTGLIPGIRDLAFDLGYTEVPVFAYSNRLRRKMLISNPMIEEVDSLFNSIFDFSGEYFDETYRKVIPLKKSDEIADGEKKLYIIDDSQLISDSDFDSELIKFGSGRLLEDIFHYVDFENNPQRKIIFIGDRNKLSFGSKTENALNTKYLEACLESKNMNAPVTNIQMPNLHIQSESEIVSVCQKISDHIKNGIFNNLTISSKGDIAVRDKSEQTYILNETYLNPSTSKVLVYSNEKANNINMWIKKHLLKNGSYVNTGDFIVFNTTIQAYPPQIIDNENSPFEKNEQPFDFPEPRRVDNGTFGEILSINECNAILKSVNVEGQKITLKFVPCQIRLQDETIVETLVFDNYLKTDSGKMDRCDTIAYQIVLSALEQETLKNEPFESSKEYLEMLKHPNDYIETTHDGVKFFKDAKDNRKLTKYEKEYKRRILSKLHNRDSEYFRLLNASKIRFAWAMTVNRAMAYSFKTIYFDTNQGQSRGKTNADYFKWLYTGISLGQDSAQLINWKPLSPFSNTEFNDVAPSNVPKVSDILFSHTNGNEDESQALNKFLTHCLSNTQVVIKEIISKKYLEIVSLCVENRDIQLFFDYNAKGEFKKPRLKTGSQDDYATVLKYLQTTNEDIPSDIGNMKEYFVELSELLSNNEITTKVVSHHDWETIFSFSNNNNTVNVKIWYTGQGMISKFNFLSGNKELFGEIVNIIKTVYCLD